MFWVITVLVFLIVLFQTPILVDLLKVFFPEWKLKRFTSQAASSLLVVLMNTFFLTGIGLHVFVFIFLAQDIPLTTLKVLCHCVFAYWVWVNMVVNYWLAVLIDPGRCNAATAREKSNEQESHPKEAQTDGGGKKEELLKVSHGLSWEVKHSHYCKTCKKVTLYMDHHCPFTSSCIGLHNYSYFFLGLLYATVGQCYSIVTNFSYFGECVFPGVWEYLNWTHLRDPNALCTTLEPYMELILPVIGGFFVQAGLLMFQIFLLLADITTYDVFKNVWTIPVFRFGWHRIKAGRYRKRDSRLNVLLLRQRPHLLWFLIPVRNSGPHPQSAS